MSNPTLEAEVISSLDDDPRIPDSLEIAVSAEGGAVQLRGTVESYAQRRAVVEDTWDLDAVNDVDDQLQVSLLGSYQRDDDEIRGAALQILMWDMDVPSDSIDVTVNDGFVTLTGDVAFQYESDAVFGDVATLYGVIGVINEITVATP